MSKDNRVSIHPVEHTYERLLEILEISGVGS